MPSTSVPISSSNKTNQSTTGQQNEQLQIGTLNMCGILTKVKYPDFTEMINDFHFLCVTETKVDKHDIITVPNYTFLSKPRSQKYLRKSGGIGVFVKQTIINNVDILDSQCEYVMWVKLKKSLFNIDHDLIIGIMYIPPEQSTFSNDNEMQHFNNEIINMCSEYSNFILTGDSNGHTAELPDFINVDNFLADYLDFDTDTINHLNQSQSLIDNKIPTQRKSQDTKVNTTGRKLIDICRNNIHIKRPTRRRLWPRKIYF